jgi:outer membrane biosynthesis protein TonB
MDGRHDDDGTLTLRAPRSPLAFLVAALLHGLACWLLLQIPEPKKPPERIQLTVRQTSPKPPSTSSSAPPPAPKSPPKKTTARPKPPTSPVAPELPPSEQPPENRAQLPVVEVDPAPAPPPTPGPTTWKDRLAEQLAATSPAPPKTPTGVLAPSFGALARVADNDPRLHDDENEARLAADFGPFFRRGLEALRGHWHPDEVLRQKDARDPTKLCGRQRRTTRAIAIIDKAGNVVDVELKDPSGCQQLDEEAIGAFLRVAQFPNPPAGLFVLPDGTPTDRARYPVRFIVTFEGGLRLEWN